MYLPSYFEQELEPFVSSKLAENLMLGIPWLTIAIDSMEVSVTGNGCQSIPKKT